VLTTNPIHLDAGRRAIGSELPRHEDRPQKQSLKMGRWCRLGCTTMSAATSRWFESGAIVVLDGYGLLDSTGHRAREAVSDVRDGSTTGGRANS
jgi:hypothetical protein